MISFIQDLVDIAVKGGVLTGNVHIDEDSHKFYEVLLEGTSTKTFFYSVELI